MLFALPTVVLLVLLIIFHKRVTTAVGLIILGISAVASTPYLFQKNPFLIAIPIVCVITWVAIKIKFNNYDFNKRILNIVPNLNKVNKGEGRIIGRCFPYYKKQLKYNNSTIALSETAIKGGMIITGSSGSGKTYGIINLIKQDLAQGKSVAFFDFKGDIETLEKIEASAPSGTKIYRLSWDECNFTYDPLSNLDDGGKVEAILNMRKWSLDGADEHYRSGTQLFLQRVIREYNHKGGNYLRGLYDFLRTYNVERESWDAYNTVIKLLELTITSNVGQMFTDGENRFDFSNKEQFLLLVAFTSSTKTLGTSITSLMLRDIMEVGVREGYDPTFCLYIDEFGSCESPLAVKDILEKGRSCGIATTISMQDLNQLIITTSAPFMDSVLGTVNTFIVYSGATRQTAEKLSGTQIFEIDDLLISLQKPIDGKPPTAMIISKYPIFRKGGTEVYRFIPKDVDVSNINEHKVEKISLPSFSHDEEQEDQPKQEEQLPQTTNFNFNNISQNNNSFVDSQNNTLVVEQYDGTNEQQQEEPEVIRINYDYFL